LAAGGLRAAPLRIAALSLASAFLVTLVFAVVDALVISLDSVGSQVHILTLAFSFICGMALVRIASQSGVTSTVVVFIIVNGIVAIIGTYMVTETAINFFSDQWVNIRYWYWPDTFLYDLIYPLSATLALTGPLLFGSVIQRQREITPKRLTSLS
jgi:hypothetical protein